MWVKSFLTGWGFDMAHYISGPVFGLIVSFQDWLGFKPLDFTYFPAVLKIGWVLAICEFDLVQVAGLIAYVASFPGFALLYFAGLIAIPARGVSARQRPGLRTSRMAMPVMPISAYLLVSWFLLYGGTTNKKHALGGCVFSAWVVATAAYRAFRATRPLDESDTLLLTKLRQKARDRLNVELVQDQRFAVTPPGAMERYGGIVLKTLAMKFYLGCAAFLRGKRGAERVSLFVLLEYVATLSWLGITSALFWTLAIKVAAPAAPLFELFTSVVAKFLPGFTASDLPPQLPLWLRLGPTLTAWVLFAVYLGVAASLLPARQEVYLASAAATYSDLRALMLYLKRKIGSLRRPAGAVATVPLAPAPATTQAGLQCSACGALLPVVPPGTRVACPNCGTLN